MAERGRKSRWAARGCLGVLILLLVLVVLATVFVWLQARRTPAGPHDYVALGSSYAAGAGLGALVKGSPLLCARSVNGYPQQLARLRRIAITDMSCGGAVTKNVLTGGQFFQGPQIRTIGPDTKLVTLTVGGNDIGYVGDLSLLAARKADSAFGWTVRRLWKGPKSPSARDYAGLQGQLVATLKAIHQRAPNATVIVATYPTILPPSGTCARIGLTVAEADMMRQVGERLAATTRAAAEQGGAILVDMNALGADHHACSALPWTSGWPGKNGAPFHPTLQGAEATATAVSAALDGRR
ncbi:SGNH/GDSL hydrolase family protein [Brevundimonas goettingensis]|uniref:SGNH/GDSL hydrolase family protein n=1 Tax=Brevundimonas goettingensis TaxID=2774190 RepID=A0A975GUV6_9CAUL|nr:SGNH/GDSL hydrolase family protein [Brevundimonas goettingensis]QTC89829.1 SGNH/GDSL hydrolase family protein [Brevundimonas goettingensis]